MKIDIPALQKRLNVTADGQAGPLTWAALFTRFGAKPTIAAGLGRAAAKHFAQYGILDNPLRLAHFIGQTAHESGGYLYMQELGGPAYFARYDGRRDLGNVRPGDGARYHGRGILQITGRANYATYGAALGIDLVNDPDQAANPEIGLLIALEYWKSHKLNALADADDIVRLTKKINGGTNGLEDRKTRTLRAKLLIL